ncbi:MAG: bifunctional phosphopantothenoylcysteine decarboxylase/phosphopantothenate--cysteine ligase CoaBC [Desulfurivibrionaceae bacterium]|jgi:phosphopantothenoylcysteine decarboxylase/phosphopantothenate--cysteine ligase|nr:bifunctional phosphopantothenoylcysteine decarboxylase/phosphopantothenate--cysteine ligase CoaBC [Desulfobulbaceae bacterium]MDP2002000.1 bifunctional phosphopantothenoylcysteine decarboxylase/phosphopantothenate--cysteine ligase CoaBC [Desulfurivibrionaceae bacterium]MDP2757013.1 bifunctional phosphopantothenoylcysteine decarboxylase/phosphopantothenate--cysteine ligase CoaBC [Desulfurivibrionaceae bacterium]
MSLLTDKKILLGITGSIAAYKVADWVRALRREGCLVTVVMTDAACRFISPLTMAALSGNPVHTSMFAAEAPEKIPHISLAREHDLLVIAPASAQTIARLAHGLADNLLATITLAASGPVLVCPAMNSAMFQHPATQANLAAISSYGYVVIEPDCGKMACNEEGPGRLTEWENVRQAILTAFAPQDLAGEQVLITAGPTREPFDPVRFLSNPSTGKMGYALAAAARQRGATVTLISGPASLPPPPGVRCIHVTSALEMRTHVLACLDAATIVVKAAAVSDFRPAETADHKIKKGQSALSLPLVANPDILKELGERKESSTKFPLLVGFAAESRDHLKEGARKLKEKNLDLIVINDIGGTETGFGVGTNRVTLLDRNGAQEEVPLLSKEETAHRIWDAAARLTGNR